MRKALEGRLYEAIPQLHAAIPLEVRGGAAYEGGKFPIWWPNLSFYDKKSESKPPHYCRFTNHPSPPRTRTLGPNPQTLMRGHCLIGCFVPEGDGEDSADDLANVVLAAYPISGVNPDGSPRDVISREGFDTFIESVDPKPPFGSLGRYYKPIHINWSCWRTEP